MTNTKSSNLNHLTGFQPVGRAFMRKKKTPAPLKRWPGQKVIRTMSIIPFDSTKQEYDYAQTARELGYRFEGDVEPIQFMTGTDQPLPREYAVLNGAGATDCKI